MFIQLRKKIGQSTVEYVVLLIILFGVFIYFQKYLVRGISGRMKSVGDSFADGRIYSPTNTLECAFDVLHDRGWYDSKCFYDSCADDCLTAHDETRPLDCIACIDSCKTPNCEVP